MKNRPTLSPSISGSKCDKDKIDFLVIQVSSAFL